MSVNYETVPSPNYAAYANPGFGAQLGQMLQGLPDQYMKGRQNAQQIALQDAFKDGLPTKNGRPDIDAIGDKLVKIGGAPYAMQLLKFLSPPPDTGTEPTIGDNQGSPSRPPPMSGAAGPSSQGAPPQPQLSSAGTDSKGDQTINSLASEVFREQDMTRALPRYAAAVGLTDEEFKAGKPLTPDQEQRARALMERSRATMASASPGDAAVTPDADGSDQRNGSRAPFMAGGRGAPAPAQGNGAPPVQVAQAQTGAGTGLPPNYTEKKAGEYETSERNHMKVADYYARIGNKEAAQNHREQAKQAGDTAKMIREQIAKNAELSGPAKEARESGVAGGPMAMEGLKVAQKQELTRGDALQKGLQGAAREFETALKPHLDAMRGILNDPNFVSGTGVGFQEALNKIRSNPLFQGLPGYDPNAALPNEAIRKVVAASILNQTTELKAEAAEMGGSAGRLFQQQISLMEKAAQNPENTAPALRYLTEMQQRMGDHSRAIAELASNYQGKYGRGVLDNGFNEVLSKYNNEHPIFKQSEIKDPRLFAPPTAPALNTKDEAVAWARKVGLRPGDPMKLPSGKIVAAP